MSSVGRPIDWNSELTLLQHLSNAIRTIRDAQYNMTAVKNVEAHSFVIPRYTWSLGAIYQAYNDNSVRDIQQTASMLSQMKITFMFVLEAGQTATRSISYIYS